jgi:hypothetical protein
MESLMDRKTAILLGAASALATGPAFAAPIGPQATPVPVAASYAELLQPIPNAVERLRAADAQADLTPARLIDAQYVRQHHHHHHHDRRWYQQNGYSWYNGAWVLRPRAHHHHHHHHSHY